MINVIVARNHLVRLFTVGLIDDDIITSRRTWDFNNYSAIPFNLFKLPPGSICVGGLSGGTGRWELEFNVVSRATYNSVVCNCLSKDDLN